MIASLSKCRSSLSCPSAVTVMTTAATEVSGKAWTFNLFKKNKAILLSLGSTQGRDPARIYFQPSGCHVLYRTAINGVMNIMSLHESAITNLTTIKKHQTSTLKSQPKYAYHDDIITIA